MYSKKINPLLVKDKLIVDKIDNDFALFDDISEIPFFDYPTKIDMVVVAICLKGTIKLSINLKEYSFTAPCLGFMLPDQILQYQYISEDFSGLFLVSSKQFINNLQLNMQKALPIFLHIKENPSTSLTPENTKILLEYYSIIKSTIKITEEAYKKEAVQCLIQGFFYSANTFFSHDIISKKKVSRKEIIFNQFIETVLLYYKENRNVDFYASKLCIVPSYLSSVIKEVSNRSASEWIGNYIILEAKVLLRSSNISIQQISDDLNFANQSFFGKYFKRFTGMSPRQYREKR